MKLMKKVKQKISNVLKLNDKKRKIKQKLDKKKTEEWNRNETERN